VTEKRIFSSAVECERAFYGAFVERDFDAMNEIWATDHVTCIHPGSTTILSSRDEVMSAWRGILSADDVPDVRIVLLARESGRDTTVHIVREEISGPDGIVMATAYATNVYRREADSWRMAAHHGSIGPSPTKKPARRSLH